MSSLLSSRGSAEVITLLLLRRLRAEPLRAILAVFAVALSTALGLALYLATTISSDNFTQAVNSLGRFDARVSLASEDIGPIVKFCHQLKLKTTTVFEEFGLINGERAVLRGVVSGADGTASSTGYTGRGCWEGLGDKLRIQVAGGEFEVQRGVVADGSIDCGVFVDPAQLSKNAKAFIYLTCPVSECEESLVQLTSSSFVQSRKIAVESVGARNAAASLAAAFTANIYFLLLIAALIAAFTIWNSFEISVASAKRDYQALKTIGLLSSSIYVGLLLEGVVIGIAGGVLGIAAYPLANGVYAATRSVITIHYASLMADASAQNLSLGVCLAAVVAAILSTILGAHLPALKAAAVAPAIVNRNGIGLSDAKKPRWFWISILGVCCLALNPLLVGRFSGEILSLAVLGIGVGIIPGCISTLGTLCAQIFRLGTVAAGELRAAAGVSARTTLFLYVSFALVVALGIMVSSFRGSVERWLVQTFAGDLYVKAEVGELPEELVKFIRDQRAEAEVISLRQRTVLFNGVLIEVQGQPLEISIPRGAVAIIQGSGVVDWRSSAGISEPFARKFSKRVGDDINLAGRQLRIAFVARDYSSDRGVIYLDMDTYQDIYNSAGIRSVSLYGISPDFARNIRNLVQEGGFTVSVNNPAQLRTLVLDIFDRTFRITDIVGVIAGVLALVGLVFTTLQLAIERRSAIRTLRTIGASSWQVFLAIGAAYIIQIGVAAGLGIIFGAALGWIMTEIINPRFFGWSIEFSPAIADMWGMPVYLFGGALMVAIMGAAHEARSGVLVARSDELE